MESDPKSDPKPEVKVKEVESNPDGSTSFTAKVPGLMEETPFKGNANLIGSESPETTKRLEQLAEKNGTTVDEERDKEIKELSEW